MLPNFGELPSSYGTLEYRVKAPRSDQTEVRWVVLGLPPEIDEIVRGSDYALISNEEARNLYFANPANVEVPLLYGSRRVHADEHGRTTHRTGWSRYRAKLFKCSTRVDYKPSGAVYRLSVGWSAPDKQWLWVSRQTKCKSEIQIFYGRLVRLAYLSQLQTGLDPQKLEMAKQDPKAVQRVAPRRPKRKPAVVDDRADWSL